MANRRSRVLREVDVRTSRREFVRSGLVLAAGAALLAAGLSPWPAFGDTSGPESGCLSVPLPEVAPGLLHEQAACLAAMRQDFSGVRLQVLATDCSICRAAQRLTAREFTARSGVEVVWDMDAPAGLLSRLRQELVTRRGRYDLLVVNDSWLPDIRAHCLRQDMLDTASLQYPGAQGDPLLPGLAGALESGLASGEPPLLGRQLAVSMRVLAYRADVFERLLLEPPISTADLLTTARRITRACAPDMYGLVAPWRLGGTGLLHEAATWIWSKGAAFYRADGRPSLEKDASEAAFEAMLALEQSMPPGAHAWDEAAQVQALADGQAAMGTIWSHQFPWLDNPALSRCVGKMHVCPMPQGEVLRPADQCGHDEHPGLSCALGKVAVISGYSRAREAAWLFLQWLSSPDVALRMGVQSGGSGCMRPSAFADERVLLLREPGPCTTRHYPVVQHAMQHQLGRLPRLPGWQRAASSGLIVTLGRMTSRQISPAQARQQLANVLRDVAITAPGEVHATG